MGAKPGTARYQGKTKTQDKDKSPLNWPAFPDTSYEQVSVESSFKKEIYLSSHSTIDILLQIMGI